MTPVIQTSELTKTFPGGITAVDSLDLRIRGGSVYGLIGPNGAGKTTLLRLLMGLLRPDHGFAHVLDHDLWQAPRELRARVAYVSQKQQLPSWMTLSELSRYAAHLYEVWDQQYGSELASRWGLRPGQAFGAMSPGDQRKAALLLAFASRPQVLLLDEPAGGLDPAARRSLLDEILDLIARGEECTVLISTHLLKDLERLVDYVGMMDQGRLILSARLEELQTSFRRVQVVFQSRDVPPGFFIPGAIQMEISGPVATALTRLVNEAQLDVIRHLPGVRLDIFPLNLEEIFLAYFGRKRSEAASAVLDPNLESQVI